MYVLENQEIFDIRNLFTKISAEVLGIYTQDGTMYFFNTKDVKTINIGRLLNKIYLQFQFHSTNIEIFNLYIPNKIENIEEEIEIIKSQINKFINLDISKENLNEYYLVDENNEEITEYLDGDIFIKDDEIHIYNREADDVETIKANDINYFSSITNDEEMILYLNIYYDDNKVINYTKRFNQENMEYCILSMCAFLVNINKKIVRNYNINKEKIEDDEVNA